MAGGHRGQLGLRRRRGCNPLISYGERRKRFTSGLDETTVSVLFATLGFTAKLALAPLRNHAGIDTVHLFHGTPEKPEGRQALNDARATTKTLGVRLVEHKIKGAFDYEAILEAFANAYAKAIPEKVYVNASGGTRVMTMASTIFAFTNDLPLLYYDEYETLGGKEIPLRAFRELRTLGSSQRAILDRLRKSPADMGALAEDVGLAPSTLSVHVQRLANAGIVTVARQGKRRVVTAASAIISVDGGTTA